MKWIKDMILSCFGGCVMFFIDINKTKTIWYKWYKKDTFDFRGQKDYTISRDAMKNKLCLYHSKFTEPISWEYSDEKTKYYITTKEFARVYNNKLLTLMLYVQEKNIIMYILIICVIIAICSGFSAVTLYDMNQVWTWQIML